MELRIVVFGLAVAVPLDAGVSSLEQGIREGENPVCSLISVVQYASVFLRVGMIGTSYQSRR